MIDFSLTEEGAVLSEEIKKTYLRRLVIARETLLPRHAVAFAGGAA